MTISTDLLADRADLIAPLTRLMEQEWANWYGTGQVSARHDLEQRSVRDRLPLGIVAYLDGGLAGTCALTETSGGLVTDRRPWIGGLLVDPACRRRGVARSLLNRAIVEARKLGFGRLFALSAHARHLFEAEDWQLIETITLDGEPHGIYVVETA